jgi:DNA adenine methylase
MKAPFPYFGGKSKVAGIVWSALGTDVTNYVEPFAGSLAVLLSRPGGAGHVETVNDFDGLLANAWRAMRADPDAVAEAADWPVNECDLHARHLWLIGQRETLTTRLMGDPDWYDAKAAGWWIWGACVWIGSGWCSGQGPWISVDGVFTDRRTMGGGSDAGKGVNRKLPRLGDAGTGINRAAPDNMTRGEYLRATFAELSARLRDTRVCCGDFERVLGPSPTTCLGMTGVFLDPPYDMGNTDPYASDGTGVAERVTEWCVFNGPNPLLRIVLAGYNGEHNILESLGWRVVAWKAHGGYGNQSNGAGRANAKLERLWMSPHCFPTTATRSFRKLRQPSS